uniref:Uncharacterized protein n=1 Tax=Solanum tuberosum TaxID=4113 RepID=M1DHP9_SOLTU
MLCGVDPVLKTSLSAEAKDFSYVDGLNWARTLSTISTMFSFAAFVGDFTCFGDKPKTVADSDGTREACCPSNLAWFLVIDTDVDPDLDANVDFELIFLKVISVFLNFGCLEEKR